MREIREKFEKIGAKIAFVPILEFNRSQIPFRIRLEKDVFQVDVRDHSAEVKIVDTRPDLRHLLLMVKEKKSRVTKILCGHDERHWFSAEVESSAKNVADAIVCLKPREVLQRQNKVRIRENEILPNSGKRYRNNKAFVRQGEWFFIPEPGLDPDPDLIHKNEPIQRGRSKPHKCEELYRIGGRSVWVHPKFAPGGVTGNKMDEIQRDVEGADSPHEQSRWTVRVADARVYVRGRISHPDHSTIVLPGWHRVILSNEQGNRVNLFLD